MGWFRLYHICREVIPCWWNPDTHEYQMVSPAQIKRYKLQPLRRIMRKIAQVSRMKKFSSEICLHEDGKFYAVDYVNADPDMNPRSFYANGVPDEIVRHIVWLLFYEAMQVAKRGHGFFDDELEASEASADWIERRRSEQAAHLVSAEWQLWRLISTATEWLSFDCYGTLVDWETGISTAVAEVLESHTIARSRAEILALFADAEPRAQTAHGYREYRPVLREVMALMADELGIRCSDSELGCLADSLPNWPVFPDATDALNTLQARYRLAIISNVDDDLFAGSARALGVEFGRCDHVAAGARLQARPARVQHRPGTHGVRQGQLAAHRGEPVPRHRAGQPHGHRQRMGQPARPGRAARARPTRPPDLEVTDLAELARIICPA